MKKFKKRVINSYYAILYQFFCVPVLSIISFFIYNTFVISSTNPNPIVNAIVLFGLVVANLGLVYYISKLFITKIKLPLVYHIIVGAATLVLIVWLNVYYNTVEYVSCANYSAVDCVHSITNGRTALLCLIASATYYLLYIFIHKIVQKNVEREAIA